MRAINFLYEEQQLDEVAMNPNALRTMASKVGATAGMEFEMIVPDMESPEDTEYENDMDSDERASSWGGIEDFFMGGNDSNYRPDVRRMIEKLQEDFYEWVNEVVWERWSDEGREYFDNYIEDEFDEDTAREEALDELAGDDPEISPDDDRVDELVREKKREWLDSEWENEGRSYDNARESFEEDERNSIDEGDWLDSNYRWMSDIWENFGSDHDVYWPYQTEINDGSELGDLADDFNRAIGRGVNASSTYHGVRNEGEYTIEPDGSLDPDDSDDTGLEFVSPPLPLDEMIKDLAKTVAWAKARGCYTNNSTGLHMNVSVPSYSFNKLDYVKLALLLGDEYVLREFGRSANGYAKSAMGKIREKLPTDPSQVQALLQQVKNGMAQEASKAIHAGHTDKYTSINTKSGYIEFRSPGGNWLDEDLDKLVNTLYRFVVALDAACDPEKYKKDYLKKLYAVLQPKSEDDSIAYFAQYAAGTLSKEQLTAMIKTMRGTATGSYWWNVAVDGQRIELVASNKEHAWEKAKDENPAWRRFNITDADIKPLRKYSDAPQAPQQARQQQYEIFTTADGRSVNNENGQPIRFNATNPEDAESKIARILSDFGISGNTDGYSVRSVLIPPAHNVSNATQNPLQQQRQYQIYRTDSGDAVTAFMAADDDAALQRLENHRAMMPSQAQALYGVRRA
jgi:hypothetical protein